MSKETKEEFIARNDNSPKIYLRLLGLTGILTLLVTFIIGKTMGLTEEVILSGWVTPPIMGTQLKFAALAIIALTLITGVTSSTIYCMHLSNRKREEATIQWKGEHKKRLWRER